MNATVLVVEDNEALAENIAELFEDAGSTVDVRMTAEDALAHARDQGFDLAIVDIGLPGQHDGLELVPQLRDRNPHGEVILVTGNASIDTAIGAVRHGAFAYVLKPFDPDELLTLGERALAQVGLRREREALERELASSEALYRGVVDTVEAAIVGLDEAGRIRMVNRFGLELGGFTLEDVEGEPFYRFGADEAARKKLASYVQAALGGEAVRERQLSMRTVQSKDRVIRWTFTPLQMEEGLEPSRGPTARVAVLAVGLDVTERLELEQRTAENEVMATLGRLTTGLAHEIRNPLNAAKLQLELLGRAAAKHGEEKITRRAEIVRSELSRLSDMLEDFLRLARPLGAQRERVSLESIFKEVLALHEPSADEKKCKLSFELAPGAEEAVGDRAKIKQVLLNLVSNALEAMDGESTRWVELRAQPLDDQWLEITVGDTGPGLPREVADRIFQPFVTTKEAGTGLGLAVVKKLVGLHGGDVDITERAGGGTVARFTLPRQAEERAD